MLYIHSWEAVFYQEARMFFDNLTITGLVIFIAAVALVVRFCVFALCGGTDSSKQDDGTESKKLKS